MGATSQPHTLDTQAVQIDFEQDRDLAQVGLHQGQLLSLVIHFAEQVDTFRNEGGFQMSCRRQIQGCILGLPMQRLRRQKPLLVKQLPNDVGHRHRLAGQ